MKIKTKNVGEIVQICKRNGWDIKNVRIAPSIMESVTRPDDYWVELELLHKKDKRHFHVDHLNDCINDNTQWPIPVRLDGKIVGYSDKNGLIDFVNTDAAQLVMNLVMKRNSIGISSRAFGKIDDCGKLIEKETTSMDIMHSED